MLREGLKHSKKVTEGEREREDRETIMRGEARTPHNVISKEQKSKVSQKPTDRMRWRMKETRLVLQNFCGNIF